MKIKNQLFLSFGFLFILVCLLGGVGSYYIKELSANSKTVIKDNIRTLAYMQKMDDDFDGIQSFLISLSDSSISDSVKSSLIDVNSLLNFQKANITEPGENNLTRELTSQINQFKNAIDSNTLDKNRLEAQISRINQLITTIYNLNENAIIQKNEKVNHTSDEVFLYMLIFSISGIVIGILFTLSMPYVITEPINEFSQAIRKVAQGIYSVSIPVKRNDEFGELASSFNKMATKLSEYEQSNYAEILAEKKRLNTVIDEFSEAVIGLDENKIILFVNQKALKLLGLKRNTIIGKYAPDIASSNKLLQTLIDDLMISNNSPGDQVYSPVKIAENNTEKLYSKEIINITQSPTGESREVLIGHVILLQDITRFAAKDKAKTRFIATLSHELKTPVAAVDMGSSLLLNQKSGTLTNEQREWVNVIKQNNDRIKRIINEVLDISKIESGLITVSIQEVNLIEILDAAINGVKPFANEKNISILLSGSEKSNLIRSDVQKSIWILNNILTNAIRYSSKNSKIEIKVSDSPYFMKVSVIDEGIGILPRDKKLIFEPYHKSPNSEPEGSGLGLAISKEFIEAMGGKIGVKSEVGKGSEFWVEFKKIA